jgi:type IV secretory pathway TrbD component
VGSIPTGRTNPHRKGIVSKTLSNVAIVFGAGMVTMALTTNGCVDFFVVLVCQRWILATPGVMLIVAGLLWRQSAGSTRP